MARIEKSEELIMLITRKHPFTGQIHTKDLPITLEEMRRWEAGELIQNVWPNLSADDREFLLTGITDFDDYIKELPEYGAENIDNALSEEQLTKAFKDGVEKQLTALPLELKEGVELITTKQPKPIRDSGVVSKKVYSTKYYYKNRIKQLRPILKYLREEVFLAGGAIRTVLECSNEEVSDFDFFFKTFEVVLELRERLIQDGWENIFSCPEEKLFTYKKGKHKLQLICEFEYGDMDHLLGEFDMTACCGGYHDGVIYFTRPFVRAVFSKKLRIQNVVYPVATIKRLIKYEKKGYNVTQAAIDLVNLIEGKSFDLDAKRVYID